VAGTRKIVTVVFSDVAGSTSLGEHLDPETVRRVMERYFDEARNAFERHGGTVEKFIGDAVMAVFGIPQVHEDDALRAVRAANELHRRVAALNEELERDQGVRIGVRTGVETGEVVAGDAAKGESFATGDAVNVAARLEQAAAPGEILIGEPTRQRLGDGIRVEAVESLSLRGKAEPVPAWRLLEVFPDVPASTRALSAPFVGRERERAELEDAFAHVAGEGSCRLVTVLGSPGIGKSRLAREHVSAVGGRASVVVGRCIPYGEGITYWPLAEIVHQLAGRDRAGIAALVAGDESADLIAQRIAGAVGLSDGEGRSEEIAWAVRKLFESLARERPLLVVLDDIHWAEPTFLDLIEYLAAFTAAPVLLLALARPDLLDERPSWVAPRPSASTIALGPLTEGESAELIRVGRGADLSEPALHRIAEASEGNPLFVEQLLAFRAEDGSREDGDLVVPPTIQALLAARIDRLEPGERAVIERASVEGRSFHRGAVSQLLPEAFRASLGADLMALVRKELIQPDQAQFAGDDGFRFVHALVQDAAYGSTAKELRADLHERFAAWLEEVVGEREPEYEEMLGYHLEQAYRYRVELGPADEGSRELAGRAAERLTVAAERAVARGDLPAQANLLSRSIALLQDEDVRRLELLAVLGTTRVWIGDFAGADAALQEAVVGTDPRSAARARIALATMRWETVAGSREDVRRDAREAIGVLQELGDDRGLARACALLAAVHIGEGQVVAGEEQFERAIEHARRGASSEDESDARVQLAWAGVWGPTPCSEALRRCEDVVEKVSAYPDFEAQALGALGCVRALEGRFDEARRLHEQRRTIQRELGLAMDDARASYSVGWVEILAGDASAAERVLRSGYERLAEFGATGVVQVAGSHLAQALAMQARFEEAERVAAAVERMDPTSVAEVVLARCARAKAISALGRVAEGEQLAREAVALIDGTEFLIDRANARMELAEVLLVAGRSDEPRRVLDEALQLHMLKGNVPGARKARTLLTELERV
jgi:class 3 adenylate cyclase/tetratricopeptide (TPR) repeat protein